MQKLVLIRHGESEWNKENRFTGWKYVDLTERGKAEAHAAGKLLKGRCRVRRGLHIGSQTRHPNAVDRFGRDGFDVDP